MAAPVHKVTHQYKLSAKVEADVLTVWCSDKKTEKRWETNFNKQSFPGKDLKDVFEKIKAAVSAKPAQWTATYPQEEKGNLYIDINDGTVEFELPEVKWDPEDIF
eukprot:CAMPEP_0202685574 /NCGR_PEP_ID=MMETSP1385-20130828/1377_1 /ASSEMBLY_ACC=CAM_ASM_000861 /TAXON_ID=933848 /ORGANISM="Elphidium margaritaceum" /LENGTH=104 /DNA_ID=CAMNT_0049339965 /DNA_START=50 /DNA_END=364 /DNA_ORIENTATION=+